MSSQGTMTAVEIGRSVYIYVGNEFFSSKLVTEGPVSKVIEILKANRTDLSHIQICHADWDTLLEWEDRVSKLSLRGMLDSAWSRRLTVVYASKNG